MTTISYGPAANLLHSLDIDENEIISFFSHTQKPVTSKINEVWDDMKSYLEEMYDYEDEDEDEEEEDEEDNEYMSTYVENPYKNSKKIDRDNINNYYNISTDNTTICTICSDISDYENRVMLSCEHVFCNSCITKWLTEFTIKCPNCNCKPVTINNDV